MDIITIILFFVYTWLLGFSATGLLKNSENFLERNLMRIGIGLGVFPILGVLFNFVHIPIDWKFFLIASLILPIYYVLKPKKEKNAFSFNLTKSDVIVLIVLLLAAVSFYMYYSGSMAYPYLEDSDSWDHSFGARYIAQEKVATEPIAGKEFFTYIDPYPPGYDILMAVLYQTSGEMIWTLKFFNSLIISLGVVFFYFFVKNFIGNRSKALFATFILFAIPCFLSHFIWAHSLVVVLMFPALYCLEKIKDDKNWKYAAAVVIAGILVVQPTKAVKFGFIFLIYLIGKFFSDKEESKHILIAGISGLALSMMWWATKAVDLFNKASIEAQAKGSIFAQNIGTASRAYSFNDFVFAKSQNMINNPIGIGPFICLLVLIAIIVIIIKYKDYIKKENSWAFIALFWLVFTFLGTNTVTFNLPIGFFAFRFWMLLAIPVSILAAEGIWFLKDFAKKFDVNAGMFILLVFIAGILATSFYQKYSVNTSVWPSHEGINPQDEFIGNGYSWISKNVPKNTGVFAMSMFYSPVLAYDMKSCEWCKDIADYRASGIMINQSAREFNEWLQSRGYSYVIIEQNTIIEYGENVTNTKLAEYMDSDLFQGVHQGASMIVLKV